MTSDVLIDTDVMIDLLRLRPEAVAFVEGLSQPPAVSAITVAELYSGVREGHERRNLDEMLDWTEIIEVNREIAQLGGLYRRDYFKSHGVGVNDAMIAATAELAERSMVTLNRKHFPMLDRVLVPY